MLVYQRVKGDRHCPTNMWPHCRDFLVCRFSFSFLVGWFGAMWVSPASCQSRLETMFFFHKTVFSSLLWRVGKRLAKSCGDVSDDTHVTNQQMIAWSQSDSCPLRICTIQPFAALEFLVVNHCLLLRVLPALIFHNGFMYASKNANVHRYVWIHTYTHTNIYICVCV